MSPEDGVAAIKESIKQWNEVHRIVKYLQGPENTEIRRHFSDAHSFLVAKVKQT